MEFNATFIMSAISFILFTLIMNAIFYKPLQKIVTERQQFIDDNYEEAKKNQKESAAILKAKDRKMEKTKQEAKKIIAEKTNEVKTQKSEMMSEAQQKARQTVDAAKDELQKSKSEAQGALSNNVVDLAQNISSKLLGENTTISNVDTNLINNIMQEG